MIDSLFPDNSPLRVSRVRRYRVPRYPGHSDPDPTTTPEPIPYPWKSGVAAALLALGETSCDRSKTESGASIPPPPDPPPPPSERVISALEVKDLDQIVATALRETPKGDHNPFSLTLGLSGLPHVSSSFGTGAPMTLDAAAAQKLITQLFVAEGLKPQPTPFAEEDFTADANGYDPEKRVGFIIGDWDNLGEGALENWMVNDLKEIASGKAKPDPGDAERWPQIVDGMCEGLVRSVRLSDEQKRELEEIRKLESPQTKAQAYLALADRLDAPKLSLAEIKHSEEMAAARQRYLAIITVFDRRFEIPEGGTSEFQGQFNAVEEEAQKRKFADHSEKWKWIREQQAPIHAAMRREQLTKLAQSVREYIAWARRSGLQ